MIDRDDMSGSGHVLHNETGIAGNIFAHVIDDESRPEIVKVARGRADNDPNGLTLVEGSLSVRARKPQRKANNQQ